MQDDAAAPVTPSGRLARAPLVAALLLALVLTPIAIPLPPSCPDDPALRLSGAGPTLQTGYPNATNTGVPAGTTLTPTGSLSITTNGTVIDAKDVNGSIYVNANNVTIKRTRIRNPGGVAINIEPGRTGILIEDVEIDGSGNTTGMSAIVYQNYTARRVHIHDFGEGFMANGNVLIEDSYLHDFTNFIAGGAHQDAIQSTGGDGLTIRHNTLLMNVDGGNSAIMLGTYYGERARPEQHRRRRRLHPLRRRQQRLDRSPVPQQPHQHPLLPPRRLLRPLRLRRQRHQDRQRLARDRPARHLTLSSNVPMRWRPSASFDPARAVAACGS